MIRFLAALYVCVIFSLYSMEKKPQLVRVLTVDQNKHWDVEKDVVDQMGVLADQIQDGNSSPFIPVNLEAKRFENILRLPKVPKVRKECLRSCNIEDVVEIAATADCLAAHSVLKQTLSVLCKRPLIEAQKLPETLQHALIARSISKNHYLKTLLLKERELYTSLLKDTDRMLDPHFSRERIIEPTNALTFECYDTKTKKRRGIECAAGVEVQLDHYPLHGYYVNYNVACDRAIYYLTQNAQHYLVFCDLQKSLFLQKWPNTTDFNSKIIHENGIVALAQGSEKVFFAYIDSPEWKLYEPFKSGSPTSLAINRSRTKVVIGSSHGFITVVDLNELEKEPCTLECHENILRILPPYQNQIIALVFNPKDDSIVATASSFSLVCLSSVNSKRSEYIGSHAKVDCMAFNNRGDLLITAGSGNRICIWSVLLKQLLHTIRPPKVQLYNASVHEIPKFYLTFSSDDRLLMLEDARSVIKFVNEETAKSIEFLPLAVVDFLIEIGKQLADKERAYGKHEDYKDKLVVLPENYRQMYPHLPLQLKELIKKNVSWSDWIWL